MTSDDLARSLDILSRARTTLVGANGLETAFDSFPQFVVVGGQSSGKSSALSRMSGVRFPTHSERCTRVAILLHLRRTKEAAPIRVTLVADGFSEEYPVDASVKHGGETEAIKKAQERAIELSEGAEFAEKYSVEILVQSPNASPRAKVFLVNFYKEGTSNKLKGHENAIHIMHQLADWCHRDSVHMFTDVFAYCSQRERSLSANRSLVTFEDDLPSTETETTVLESVARDDDSEDDKYIPGVVPTSSKPIITVQTPPTKGKREHIPIVFDD